jgi:hypothetical protein
MALSPVRASDSLAALLMIRQLQARDTVVRAHEAAHIAAGGGTITSGASYSYQKGPDGREYAIGGEVGIDASPVPGDPKATIAKMATVRAAALAPAQPSGQDLSVAASASMAEAQARAEAYRQKPDNQPTIDLMA